MNIVLAVFVGGGLGSVARYGLSVLFQKLHLDSFPLATLASNTFSCFLIGYLIGTQFWGKDTSIWKPFLAVGFCGGFSTFSAFSVETLELAKNGMVFQALLNGLTNMVLCLSATAVGMWLGRGG